jgi:intergrase/recombinase
VVHRKVKRDVPWWGKELQEQRREVRRLQNKKKVKRAEFKRALTAYSIEIRRLKRKSFVRFTEEIIDTRVASRLRKILSKEHSNGLGTFIKADGSHTGDQRETLETLMLSHFVRDPNVASEDILKTMDGSRDEAWRRSRDLLKGIR